MTTDDKNRAKTTAKRLARRLDKLQTARVHRRNHFSGLLHVYSSDKSSADTSTINKVCNEAEKFLASHVKND